MLSPDQLRSRYHRLPVRLARAWSLAGRRIEDDILAEQPDFPDETLDAVVVNLFDVMDQRDFGKTDMEIITETRETLRLLGEALVNAADRG